MRGVPYRKSWEVEKRCEGVKVPVKVKSIEIWRSDQDPGDGVAPRSVERC